MKLPRAGTLVAMALLPACVRAPVTASPPAPPAPGRLLLADAVPAPTAGPAGAGAAAAPVGQTPAPAPVQPASQAQAPQTRSSSPPADHGVQADGSRHDRALARMAGWISIGVGSLAGVVALGTSITMLHDKSVRDGGCNTSKVCSPDALGANADIAGTAGWNLGAYLVAAAGLGVGAFLVITNPADPETATRVGVSPTASGATLSLRSSF